MRKLPAHEVMDRAISIPVKIIVPFWMACMTTAVGVTLFYTWGWVLIALGMPLPLNNIKSVEWYCRDCKKLSRVFFSVNITLVGYILIRIYYPEINIL